MTASFAVADMTLHRVVEMETPFMKATDMLPGLTEAVLAENRAWLAPRALSADDQLILCVQSYVVRTPHHVVLIDTCIGNHKPRAGRPSWHMKTDGAYMAALAGAGLTVDDVDYVLCTHLHADHVGWNTQRDDGRWVPTFPKARYVFARAEHDHWVAADAKAPVPAYRDSVLPVVEAGRAELVASDHAIGDHVRLIPTPGHTPGHVAIGLGKGGDAAVMTGDLIHSPLQARYPELSPRFDADPAEAARTRRDFLARYCDTATLCCTAHFPSPSVGRIKRWDDGFRCEPA